jgi:hypothetical protein
LAPPYLCGWRSPILYWKHPSGRISPRYRDSPAFLDASYWFQSACFTPHPGNMARDKHQFRSPPTLAVARGAGRSYRPQSVGLHCLATSPVVAGCDMRGKLSGVLGGPGEVREGYSRLLFNPRPYERMARYPVTQDHSARYRPLSAAGCSSAESKRSTGGSFQKEVLAPGWRPSQECTPGNR